MTNRFFERPILNSPYAYPGQHWELDQEGQPTNRIADFRRRSDLITPVPKPKKRRRKAGQIEMVLGSGDGLSTAEQEYNPTPIINEIRTYVEAWRKLPNPNDWQVTPETARLLQHWRHHRFHSVRPFFCQVEAVETAIWLTEVAPKLGKRGEKFWAHIKGANEQANPQLLRIALKLATGAGKTTVMAMLIAWQTVNAARHPNSKTFSRGFLIITPGITIRDRLRVLMPNDPDSYYKGRELIPSDMLPDIDRAKIVLTNYHAFKLRERIDLAKGTRLLLKGRGPELNTLETEGQMLQRVMPDLMGLKNIVVLNDEAHHCYRERPREDDGEEELKGEEKDEAKKNNEAARLWISGIEAVKRKLGLRGVYDLSATPFFLRGSGYREGTLFHWTVSDFSLMDAIECGIVKLPRLPISDNIPGHDMPIYRNLWEHIRSEMPKKGRGKLAHGLDPLSLPTRLQTALEALYGHYRTTFESWQVAGIEVPPVFIVVCNNTSASKLVYDFISGFHRTNDDGSTTLENGRLELFRNYDEHGNRLPRPRTLLIDSEQLESGEALDKDFRDMASDEIERFRREIVERTGDARAGDNISDQDLLREVMNTVGKKDRLGEPIRCVVSSSGADSGRSLEEESSTRKNGISSPALGRGRQHRTKSPCSRLNSNLSLAVTFDNDWLLMIDPSRYRGREQTFVKHFFLDRYLERVAYVTLAGSAGWSDFTFVDAFSGPWRSGDENLEDTSVFIALTKLAAVRQVLKKNGRDVNFRTLFVEKNPTAFQDLQRLVARFPDAWTRTILGEFEDHVDEARQFINNAFSLIFVDPTGWRVLDLNVLQPLLRLRGEVIINFTYNDINRHLENPQPGVRASFDPIFGGPSWRSEIEQRIVGGEDREAAIIGVFCNRLRAAGSFEYVTSTRVMQPLAERTYFYLVYGTRHWKGVEEFRSVEKQALEVQESVRFNAKLDANEEKSGIRDLFRGESLTGRPPDFYGRRARSLETVRQRLRELLSKKSAFPASEAFGCLLEQPLVFPDVYRFRPGRTGVRFGSASPSL